MEVGSIYQWTIVIEKYGKGVTLGIRTSNVDNPPWGLFSRGMVFRNRDGVDNMLPEHGTGKKVIFTLDLSKVTKNTKTGGKLIADIDGHEVCIAKNIAAEGIKIGMDFKSDAGFYPYVDGTEGSCVVLVKLNQLGNQAKNM